MSSKISESQKKVGEDAMDIDSSPVVSKTQKDDAAAKSTNPSSDKTPKKTRIKTVAKKNLKRKSTEEGEKEKKKNKKETAKPSKPSDLDKIFVNKEALGLWNKGNKNMQVLFCKKVDDELLVKLESIEWMRNIRKTSLFKFFNLTQIAYPNLVRQFYTNLDLEKSTSEQKLFTRVGGVDLIIDRDIIVKALGITEDNGAKEVNKKNYAQLAKEICFIDPNPRTKFLQLTQTQLNAEAKILFYLLVRMVTPKENSKELLTDKLLFLMYEIMNGEEIDVPSIIIDHIISCYKASMPYANLLTLIFTLLGVEFEGEDKEKDESKITEKDLGKIRVVQTEKGSWDFKAAGEVSGERGLIGRIGGLELEMKEVRKDLNGVKKELSAANGSLKKLEKLVSNIIKAMGAEEGSVDTTSCIGHPAKKIKKVNKSAEEKAGSEGENELSGEKSIDLEEPSNNEGTPES